MEGAVPGTLFETEGSNPEDAAIPEAKGALLFADIDVCS